MSLLHQFSATKLVSMRRSGELSALEVVEYFLARIDTHNPSLHALVTVTTELARDRAIQMDKGEIEPGLLWGLP
ncbi:MAG: hypothetical protein ACO373_06210, partial [Pontimonas sp.]